MQKNEKLSVGNYLKETRIAKGLSIEEIMRETNISKKYLEAIENDNFDIFPAETYTIGFISTYAEALEIDKDKVISIYKKRLQLEQDIPLDELLGEKKKELKRNISISAIAVIIVFIIAFFLYKFTTNTKKSLNSAKNVSKTSEQAQSSIFSYNLENLKNISDTEFKSGDIIIISNNLKAINVKIQDVKTKNVYLVVNDISLNLKLNELLSIDADKDGTKDLNLEVYKINQNRVNLSISLIKSDKQDNANVSYNLNDFLAIYRSAIINEETITKTINKDLIDLKLTSSSLTYVRYNIDGKEEKELSLTRGNTVNLKFNLYLILQIGNAGALTIEGQNFKVSAGERGEVLKFILYWKYENGEYHLVKANLN